MFGPDNGEIEFRNVFPFVEFLKRFLGYDLIASEYDLIAGYSRLWLATAARPQRPKAEGRNQWPVLAKGCYQ